MKKKKLYILVIAEKTDSEKMLILTFPFTRSPLKDCILNNIDLMETNKTTDKGYSLTKASGFLPSLVTAQKQQM